MDQDKIKKLIKEYNNTGRIAFYYPRLKRISLHGGQSMPENEAIKRIQACITDFKKSTLKTSL